MGDESRGKLMSAFEMLILKCWQDIYTSEYIPILFCKDFKESCSSVTSLMVGECQKT